MKKSFATLVAALLANAALVIVTPALAAAGERVHADAKTEASESKAAAKARYKRIRAKAHRNAALAKAHARALRAENSH
jgi:hypothetical protein